MFLPYVEPQSDIVQLAAVHEKASAKGERDATLSQVMTLQSDGWDLGKSE